MSKGLYRIRRLRHCEVQFLPEAVACGYVHLWDRFSIDFYLIVGSAMSFLQLVWHNPWDQNQWSAPHPSIGYRSLSGIAALSYDHLIDHPWRLFRSPSTGRERKHRWVLWEVFTEHSLIFIERELRYRYRIDKSQKITRAKWKYIHIFTYGCSIIHSTWKGIPENRTIERIVRRKQEPGKNVCPVQRHVTAVAFVSSNIKIYSLFPS